MGSFSDTPALIAGGTIAPFRFVAMSSSADDTGVQASADTDKIVGVSDGSTNGPLSGNHATVGQPITLQGGANGTVLVECAGNITVGALVETDSSGKAQAITTTAGTTRYHGFVALQGGAAGRIIRVQRIAGYIKY